MTHLTIRGADMLDFEVEDDKGNRIRVIAREEVLSVKQPSSRKWHRLSWGQLVSLMQAHGTLGDF